MAPMLHVGLTGGLASGKSTVAALFAELGAAVIDADKVAREVVAIGTPGLDAVLDAFGPEVRGPDGALDRDALAQIVFDDDAELRRLNAIVHPLVREATAARVARIAPDRIVVHDVPLLVENGMGAQYQLVVVVGASVAVRTERAVARGLTESQAVARIAAQADDRSRRVAADVWVDNEGTADNLQEVVDLLWRARIAPFAQNLCEGRWAEPGEIGESPEAHKGWPEQADRLIARLERVGSSDIGSVSYVPPADEPTLDVIELRAQARRDDDSEPPGMLRDAGFVLVREGVYANADPGRPAVLSLDAPGR